MLYMLKGLINASAGAITVLTGVICVNRCYMGFICVLVRVTYVSRCYI